ncbi:MAG: GNAT family N-acetyltransferase [Gammaproteobacteria bacterium]|jgi:ribosomal protein S18 acetylase RimI-like enzyme|nr:GNAT family N-acetyltransferase [Gammaproteobacteria bacterium]
MSINIINADLRNPRHASALLDLLNHYASGSEGGGRPLSDYTRQHLIQRLQQRGDTLVILAWDGDKPVGLIIGFEGFSTFMCKPLLNIHDVVVLENYRGQGIAQQMLAAAETMALLRGCCKITLEVLSNNAPAQAAYRKAGFAAYELDPGMGQALFWEKKL